MIQTKRVYDEPAAKDGKRFLVDRLWPRGMKKEALPLDGWLKELAPSESLRRWFAHDPEKWDEFQKRYFAELRREPQLWEPLRKLARKNRVTLLFGARDVEHNNAIALKRFLDKELPGGKIRSPKIHRTKVFV